MLLYLEGYLNINSTSIMKTKQLKQNSKTIKH